MPPPTVHVISIVIPDLLSGENILTGKQAEVWFMVKENVLHHRVAFR
jgi:hypothetical protein